MVSAGMKFRLTDVVLRLDRAARKEGCAEKYQAWRIRIKLSGVGRRLGLTPVKRTRLSGKNAALTLMLALHACDDSLRAPEFSKKSLEQGKENTIISRTFASI